MGDEGSSLGNENRGNGPLVTVPLMTYDSFVKAHVDPAGTRIIDFLYVDTEGYEPGVLAGAAATLPYTRIVVFEYGASAIWATTSLLEVSKQLDAIGFDCFITWRDSLVRVNGGCWASELEIRSWSNVLCVNRRDAAWTTAIGRYAKLVTYDA